MGWKGTLRSMQAASRAAERSSQRRQRELKKQQKEYEKMQALEQAAYEVEVYENHVELLLSVHKECGEHVDWQQIAAMPAPSKPEPTRSAELKAVAKLASYKPGLIARVFGLEAKQRTKLQQLVEASKGQDQEKNRQAETEWQADFNEWSEEVELAERVLNGNPSAKLDAIKRLDRFTDISELGSELYFSVGETGVIECSITVHGREAIPTEIKSLLQSGKLSVKKMPAGKFNELEQDYVCSCVLRVANELFNALPEDMVIITAEDSLLNTATGHTEKTPILSVAVSRATLYSFNLSSIDPSDAMANFVHKMAFKKTTGFAPVERLNPAQFA